jgi:hypothetical protein
LGAVGLAFVTEPSDAVAGAALPVQPAVAVVDAAGHVVTSGPSSAAPITLAFAANTGGGNLACSSGLALTTASGTATFAGCAVSQPGLGYSLVATSPGLGSAVSSPFAVLPVGGGAMPRTLTMAPSATTLIYGASLNVAFTLQASGQSAANRLIELQWSGDGAEWETFGTTTTDASGTGSVTLTVRGNGFLRGALSGAPDLGALTSPLAWLAVRQTITLRPTNKAAKSITRGTAVTFTATVRPVLAQVQVSVTFKVYRKVGTKWVLSAKRVAKASAAGIARLRWTFSTVGEWYVQASANATFVNAGSLPSRMERYSVR